MDEKKDGLESETTVVNITKEPCDEYIGRPMGKKWKSVLLDRLPKNAIIHDGYFGNPFIVGKHGDRARVIERYLEYFLKRIEEDAEFRSRVRELRGKRLGCFCKPLACHGDVIVEWLRKDQS